MGWDGPQERCPSCAWMNFTIRTKCRNCGAALRDLDTAKKNMDPATEVKS